MYIIILYAVQLIDINFFVMSLIFSILYRFGNILRIAHMILEIPYLKFTRIDKEYFEKKKMVV